MKTKQVLTKMLFWKIYKTVLVGISVVIVTSSD